MASGVFYKKAFDGTEGSRNIVLSSAGRNGGTRKGGLFF